MPRVRRHARCSLSVFTRWGHARVCLVVPNASDDRGTVGVCCRAAWVGPRALGERGAAHAGAASSRKRRSSGCCSSKLQTSAVEPWARPYARRASGGHGRRFAWSGEGRRCGCVDTLGALWRCGAAVVVCRVVAVGVPCGGAAVVCRVVGVMVVV
eukprot:892696-Prymnesium_polylepis.1